MPDFSVRAISISNAFVRVSKVLLVLVLDFPKPVLYTPLATVRCAALRLTLTAWGYRLPLCCRLFKASHIPQRLRNLQSLATLLSGNPTLTCQISVCIVLPHTLPIYDVFALTIRFWRIFHASAACLEPLLKPCELSPCLVLLAGELLSSGVLNLHP